MNILMKILYITNLSHIILELKIMKKENKIKKLESMTIRKISNNPVPCTENSWVIN